MLLANFLDIPNGLLITGFCNKVSALALGTQLLMHPPWKQLMTLFPKPRMR